MLGLQGNIAQVFTRSPPPFLKVGLDKEELRVELALSENVD